MNTEEYETGNCYLCGAKTQNVLNSKKFICEDCEEKNLSWFEQFIRIIGNVNRRKK